MIEPDLMLTEMTRALTHDGREDSWTTRHPEALVGSLSELNTGTAGTMLAFAHIAHEPQHAELLAAIAQHHLANESSLSYPGLYVGGGGDVLAFIKVGQVFHCNKWVTEAARRGRIQASIDTPSPDVFNGTAGQLRCQLILYLVTGDKWHLRAAERFAQRLFETKLALPGGSFCWRMPEGYSTLSNKVALGYAHGAAGIADALLDLFILTGSPSARIIIEGVLTTIRQHAVSGLPDGSGLNWGIELDEHPSVAFWCHGAAGIARFCIRAMAHGFDGAAALARAAARTVALTSRWAGPTQCHGLAGNLEVLIDAHVAFADIWFLEQAHTFATLLSRFAIQSDSGTRTCSDSPRVVSPDLMVGYSGVAAALYRLLNPTSVHLLSLEAFSEQPVASQVLPAYTSSYST